MLKKGITNDNVEQYSNTFFISINGTRAGDGIEWNKTYFTDKENVKVIFFDDVDKDYTINIVGTGKTETVKALTEQQAEELFEFIDKHKDKETCMVHCAAGISRSGAVGQFINDYTRSDKEVFKRNNPHILPNNLVVRLLHKEANKQ